MFLFFGDLVSEEKFWTVAVIVFVITVVMHYYTDAGFFNKTLGFKWKFAVMIFIARFGVLTRFLLGLVERKFDGDFFMTQLFLATEMGQIVILNAIEDLVCMNGTLGRFFSFA